MKFLKTETFEEYSNAKVLLDDLKKESKETTKQLKADHAEKVKQLKKDYEARIERLEIAAHKQEVQIEALSADKKALESLRKDEVSTKTTLLELEEREATLKTREENCKKAEATQEIEDSKKYKSGYEDGVADGLRRGYELTSDDRQNMASIAALAAASHSDGATQKIAESIVIGMEKTRASKQLSAGSKKKS